MLFSFYKCGILNERLFIVRYLHMEELLLRSEQGIKDDFSLTVAYLCFYLLCVCICECVWGGEKQAQGAYI